jgi:hypothetical protein
MSVNKEAVSDTEDRLVGMSFGPFLPSNPSCLDVLSQGYDLEESPVPRRWAIIFDDGGFMRPWTRNFDAASNEKNPGCMAALRKARTTVGIRRVSALTELGPGNKHAQERALGRMGFLMTA